MWKCVESVKLPSIKQLPDSSKPWLLKYNWFFDTCPTRIWALSQKSRFYRDSYNYPAVLAECLIARPFHWSVQNRIVKAVRPLNQPWCDVSDELLLTVRWTACTQALSREEWLWLCVCVFDKGSSRVTWRQEARAQCQQRGCVDVCRQARKCGCSWTWAISHFTNTGHSGKGYYASPPLCVWEGTRANVKDCFFFPFFIPVWEPSEALAGDSTHDWQRPSHLLEDKSNSKQQKQPDGLCLCLSVVVHLIYFSDSPNTNPCVGSSKLVFYKATQIEWNECPLDFFFRFLTDNLCSRDDH